VARPGAADGGRDGAPRATALHAADELRHTARRGAGRARYPRRRCAASPPHPAVVSA
jgi:hypothetical protein